MNIEEFKKKIKSIDDEAKTKKKVVCVEYAMSHNSVATGDVIEDHIGRIKVEKINVQIPSFQSVPVCVYFGVEMTKNGNRSKKDKKRWVYQSNLKL